MARGINKVILIGNLGIAPDVRYAPGSTAPITTLSIATSESWKDKQTGEKQERTEWHRVVFFNRLAEVARDYLKKGSKVYVEGSLRTRKWMDKNTNQERYMTEIMGNELQMLDSRGAGDSSIPADYESMMQQSPEDNNMPSSQASSSSTQVASSGVENHANKDFNDDIPF